MPGRTTLVITLALLVVAALVPGTASAHERYFSDDDKWLIVLGEQNEPVYTYDFTNLDIILSDNSTGAGVPGAEETLNATLIAPNGEELTMPLEPQRGETGRYQFAEDYVLTLAGQYKVRLEGEINGTDVTGEYLLPGPRESFTEVTFPHDDVAELRELSEENAELRAQVDDLESQVTNLGSRLDELERALLTGGGGGDGDGDGGASQNTAPGLALVPLLVVLGAVALIGRRD